MTTSLRIHLVLDVQTGDARVLEDLHRASHVHGLTEPGVGVDDRREIGHPGDLSAALGHFAQRRETNVGQTKVRREHRARDVDAVETLSLNESGRERIERAGHKE